MMSLCNSEKRIVSNADRLRIVDLARGAPAMQFGTAIVVARSLIRGENIGETIVDSIDINQAMLIAGWDGLGTLY